MGHVQCQMISSCACVVVHKRADIPRHFVKPTFDIVAILYTVNARSYLYCGSGHHVVLLFVVIP